MIVERAITSSRLGYLQRKRLSCRWGKGKVSGILQFRVIGLKRKYTVHISSRSQLLDPEITIELYIYVGRWVKLGAAG